MPGPDPDGPSSDSSRWKDSKTSGALRNAGASLSSSGASEIDRASSDSIKPSQYRKGGKVRKAKPRS